MKRRRLRFILVALLAAALLMILFTDLLPFDIAPFLPKVRLQRSETWNTSTVTLEAVRDLYEFRTVEYVHSAVFPHDYYVPGVTGRDISRALRRELTASQISALPDDERLQYQALALASDIGMDVGGHDFIVVTVVVTAGFHLADAGLAVPATQDEQSIGTQSDSGFRVEVIRGAERDIRRAIVPTPMAEITETRVEDIVPEDYPYPDVTISADAWRRVAEFVEEHVVSVEQIDELLRIADRNGRDFVREVLIRAGYDEVLFEG